MNSVFFLFIKVYSNYLSLPPLQHFWVRICEFYIFKIYNMLFSYLYTLNNEDIRMTFCVLKDLWSFIYFKQMSGVHSTVTIATVPMLYLRSPELICVTEALFAVIGISCFPSLSVPGIAILFCPYMRYEFDLFRFHT